MHVSIRMVTRQDKAVFLEAAQRSPELHSPWVGAPCTEEAFDQYVDVYSQPTHRGYLVFDEHGVLVGVFNISAIVRGLFQSAYLGFYAFSNVAAKGCMSAGLKMILKEAFVVLKLHRVEANIQPENTSSIYLVKSNHFHKEGHARGYLFIDNQWRDHERWAITYEDWERESTAPTYQVVRK
jgi:[ribosomal protein S5]-alanine N-acetyltransferase